MLLEYVYHGSVMEDRTIEAMPTVVEVCEWVNRRNITMFLTTC